MSAKSETEGAAEKVIKLRAKLEGRLKSWEESSLSGDERDYIRETFIFAYKQALKDVLDLFGG